MTKQTPTDALNTIASLDEIPHFRSEQEEATFWKTHELNSELWDALPRTPDDDLPPRTRSVAVCFDDSTVRRLKVLALRRHKRYQTLLKEFDVERLNEEEKRAGLVG